MSDGEMVDLVVRGLTREEVYRWAGRDDSDEDYCVLLALAARRQVAEWEREERDATSYTDEQGRRLWLERGEGGVAIAAPDGDPLVPHPALLAAVNAARERDGLPRLVEESVDGACSDPTCSYRAEMDGLSAACKGMGCQVSPVLSEILLAEDSP
jgi:hypothetical protein